MPGGKKICIIGGGASGLVAADLLAQAGHSVTIYEKGKTVGRKFLVAGKGGFNLSNKAEGKELLGRYTSTGIIQEALNNFTTEDTRKYFADLGIPTFIGSSGRVFPERGIKPVEVLQAIKNRLKKNGVSILTKHQFIGFNDSMKPLIQGKEGTLTIESDKYFFALGGASWSVTGSDGSWLSYFKEKGIKTILFRPSNCGLNIKWDSNFKEVYAGHPLKNISLRYGAFQVKGEALVTEYGLEGNAVYPLSSAVRNAANPAFVGIDLKPQLTQADILARLGNAKIRPKNYAYFFKLDKVKMALAKSFTTKEEYLNPELFTKKIKDLHIPVESLRPIEEAISTVGGIAESELNSDFSLKQYSQIHIIGEMSDWDAPTGGFLLQACFASAVRAAKDITV